MRRIDERRVRSTPRRFLAEAIESVLAQDHEPAEVIVVDDGSTEGTAAVRRAAAPAARVEPRAGGYAPAPKRALDRRRAGRP